MTTRYLWGGQNNPELHNAIQEWVSFHSFGHPQNKWRESSSYGVLKNGAMVAGVVYHDFKADCGTIQYSGASIDRTWLQGPSLHHMFSYMFDTCNCQMVLTGNSEKNTGLHSILKRLSHTKHVIKRGWGRHEDLFLWTLTKEDWLANEIMGRSRERAEESSNV